MMIFSRKSLAVSLLTCVLVMSGLSHVAAQGPRGPRNVEEKLTAAQVRSRKSRRGRDPFWPVGYAPESVMERTFGGVDWKGATGQLKIQTPSRSPNGDYFVIISGQAVAVGETVEIKYLNYVYTWTVQSIDITKGVSLRPDRAAPAIRSGRSEK